MAEQQQRPSDTNQQITYSRVGLNTDSIKDQVQKGYVTDALNAIISNFDGNSITYQNEEGSEYCFTVPDGYKVIGRVNITQLSKVLYCLVNPTTGNSLVSYVDNNDCTLLNYLDDSISGSDLLNFNINHPILKFEVKSTNCSTQVYFTDNFNPRRFIDLNDLPWRAGIVGQIDTNKMLVQPVFSVPKLTPLEVNIGGNLVEGDYQFAFQYANISGDGLTSYYSVTNPVRIFLEGKISQNYNTITNKSISISINDMDTTGLYTHYNLAVIKTINAITTVELIGTFDIQGSTAVYTYTGNEQSNANTPLSITDIREKFPYYDLAGDLTQSDNVLIWADLTKQEDISYQKIFNQVKVGWQSWQVPTTQSEGYFDGVNCANIEGFMRDEVYALEGCLTFDDGKESPRCSLIGRAATPFDLQLIPTTNKDIVGTSDDICDTPLVAQPRWKVYNTGSVTGTSPEYKPGDSCYKGPYQYGEMSYWESTEKYPNNPAVWGSLANKNIRHHKFPDSVITHIHDQNPYPLGTDEYNNYNHFIYPIGFSIDINSLYTAIQSSTDLTPAQKRKIVGFKIMRSDRNFNTTIVAKGIIANVGEYTKDNSTFYYANYPFNDVNPDPFISKNYVADKSGANLNSRLDIFHKNRYTFHSPDTHFDKPSGIQGSYVKLETAEFGNCKAHFVQVENNAGEKLKTEKALQIALAAGISSLVGLNAQVTTGTTATVTISPTISPQNFFPSYNAMLDIVDKLIPYNNYGWQYNGIGYYGNFSAVPNGTGNKIRFIENGGYINSGLQGTFGDDHTINNTFRESSVYVKLNDDLPFTHQNASVPQDNSRVTAGMVGVCGVSDPFFRTVSSYYASIKRNLPGQYGQIFSYPIVDTGAYSKFFDENNNRITKPLDVFGGDIFINPFSLKIKHSFFLNSAVGKADNTDVSYNQDAVSHTNTGNIGYPIWYYSTVNKLFNINNGNVSGQITNFVNTFSTFPGLLFSFITLGLLDLFQALLLIFELISNGILTTLGVKITNLECANYDDLYEKGQAYLYAYGIVRFFVESQVNVDMRQAYNLNEGNFYPNVGTDIPDQWLQEINTPILYDNTYTYNKTYSKQNSEPFFSLLRADWEPNQDCYTYYNNLAIWSDRSNLEETKNNWLIYRPANRHLFPKGFGKLKAVDALENKAVLVRFENKSQIYNAMATIATSQLTAALGTGDLFSGTPIDLSNTDSGYYGTQNKFILNTPNGHIFIDAKRGQVPILRGTNVENLSSPKYLNSKWFSNNLPFNILRYFPNVDIDNNYNGIGIHGVYDDFYNRLIITKLDYEPIVDGIKYDGENFYIDGLTIPGEVKTTPGVRLCCPDGYIYYPYIDACRKVGDLEVTTPRVPCPGTEEVTKEYQGKIIVSLTDPLYFCDKSWSISYSFLTNTWVSYHSYQPNFYVQYENYFQAGLNNELGIWDHNSTFSKFNNFFGTLYPYILEYPFSYRFQDEILQSIKEYCTVLKYNDYNLFTEPKETIYFNKSTIYNGQACTGVLNLVPKLNNNLAQYRQYPKYNSTSKDILVTKTDNFYVYNQFWDTVIDPNDNIWLNVCGTKFGNKELNNANLDYTNKAFKKYPLRAKDSKVRHILDDRDDVKILSHFIIQETQNSYK